MLGQRTSKDCRYETVDVMGGVFSNMRCIVLLSDTEMALPDSDIFTDVSTSADLGCAESKIIAAKSTTSTETT